MLRLMSAAGILGLGLWLAYGALDAVVTIVGRGSPIADALLSPPTSLIRLTGSGLMTLGGLLAVLSRPLGGSIGAVGSLITLGFGILLAVASNEASQWSRPLLYGIAGTLMSILVLTLRRE